MFQFFHTDGTVYKSKTLIVFDVYDTEDTLEIDIAECGSSSYWQRAWIPVFKLIRELERPEVLSEIVNEYTFINRSGKCLTFLKDYLSDSVLES